MADKPWYLTLAERVKKFRNPAAGCLKPAVSFIAAEYSYGQMGFFLSFLLFFFLSLARVLSRVRKAAISLISYSKQQAG